MQSRTRRNPLLPRPRADIANLARGARLREALIELGPIFVKAGQILSTRRDLLPDDIANELAMLQDRVPPFPGGVARAAIEAALGAPVATLYKSFDETPLASASIAQVHAAQLPDGSDAVVKVLRPGIHATLRSESGGRVMLCGGEAFTTPRHVWWNFVSSDRDRINQAKEDWKAGNFPKVPGDEVEFIPLPE